MSKFQVDEKVVVYNEGNRYTGIIDTVWPNQNYDVEINSDHFMYVHEKQIRKLKKNLPPEKSYYYVNYYPRWQGFSEVFSTLSEAKSELSKGGRTITLMEIE